MLRTLLTFRNWTLFSLLCIAISWSFPAQADPKIDPQLEQQVLEIIRQHPEIILESVQSYREQQQQKVEQARQEFIQEFQSDPQGVIGNSPMSDPTQLKTVLMEFSDFQCPYCANAHKILERLLAKYPHRFTLVYKFFPLTQIHPEALPSAKAAWAAYQQGKFWQYHDALFAHQQQLGETLYLDIAKKLRLDLTKFKLDRTLAKEAIQNDLKLVNKLQVSGTPYFLIKSPNYAGAIELTAIEGILQHKH